MRKTIALAFMAAALAGCGMVPSQQGGGGEEKQQAGEQTTVKQPVQAAETNAPAEQRTAPPQQGTVIASRETKVAAGGQYGKARVDITALKRQGKTISLNWTVTATEGSVNLHNGMGSSALDYSVSAVSLIDPVNAKRYRVARNGTDANAECVCSGTQGQFLKSSDATTLYAVFAAPPADVTKINIEMPMVGVFTDVPIS
ncbi:hypothetical protein ABGB18_45550 [Nonomuraea sp. B12E4]|uniref:hypothetical protein n=1 Tax=Nonomuraea sp. B12E4 TaxID=3153564 RepID=UPI00325CDB86